MSQVMQAAGMGAPARQKQIPAAMDELRRVTCLLEERFGLLQSKIAAVTAQQSTSDISKNAAASFRVPLADEIHDCCERLSRMSEDLSALNEGVEL